MLLKLERLSLLFGSSQILSNISLEFNSGEMVSIVGPSGSGKTSLLRCISALEKNYTGIISFGGKKVSSVADYKNSLGFVFQDLGLFENTSARQNILLGEKASSFKDDFEFVLERLGIHDLVNKKVDILSGGERQRIAIARCLIRRPSLILMDEPFSSLDLRTTIELEHLITELQAELGFTLLYVTHDQSSAARICPRMIVLKEGQIEQEGTYNEIYYNPVNENVMNFVSNWPINSIKKSDSDNTIYIRPEKLSVKVSTTSGISKCRLVDLELKRVIPSIPMDYLVFTNINDSTEYICTNSLPNELLQIGRRYELEYDAKDIISF